MTQLELAEKSDVSKTTIALILAKKYNPSLEIMSKIANVLAIPLYMFFINENGLTCQKHTLNNGQVVITAVLSKIRAFQVEKWHSENKH